jgi:hypothetical protein
MKKHTRAHVCLHCFEFRVSSFEFRVPSSEFRVSSSEFRVSSFEFRVSIRTASGSDRPNTQLWSATITLKAFANFSPDRGPRASSPRGVGAFALKPWVKKGPIYFVATLKELRGDCDSADGDATLSSGLRLQKHSDAFPRVSKQTLPPRAGCSRGDPGLG